MNSSTGKYIIVAGGIMILIGIVIVFFGDKLGWIGRLPGDIRYEGGNTKVYFPITTMILISLLLTLIINLIKRF
jgi:hypothetical protein